MSEEERPEEQTPEQVEAEPMDSGGDSGASAELTSDEKTMAMIAHGGAGLVQFLSAGFLAFLVPLIVYITKKDDSRFVEEHAKESLNFQITLVLAHIVAAITICFTFGILNLIVWIAGIIFSILAAIEANNGKPYQYPLSLRLIK